MVEVHFDQSTWQYQIASQYKIKLLADNSYCVIFQMILIGVASKHISLLRTYHKESSRRYSNIIWNILNQLFLQF